MAGVAGITMPALDPTIGFLVGLALLAFIGIIVVVVVAAIVAAQNASVLRRGGIRVVATVVKLDEGFTYNSFHRRWEWQYWVTVLWTDQNTHQQRTFQSARRSARPNCRLNDPVIVFLDPHNPTRYLVGC
jgi:hypothetical protein